MIATSFIFFIFWFLKVAASSHANSSNTVTTTQAGPGSKRPRDNSTPAEDEGAKSAPAVSS